MSTRILVTGFSAFPRAPVNPSQVLVELLAGMTAQDLGLGPDVDLFTQVLPVEYEAVPGRLEELGRDVAPDIAIHFGLAETAAGFRLERTARNVASLLAPDAAGYLPLAASIADGADTVASTLPLEAIAAALKVRGLPVQSSVHAGTYLCNFLFYRSCAGLHAGFRPSMAGFVHIPFLDTQLATLSAARAAKLPSLSLDHLVDGARIILATCAAEYRAATAQVAAAN